MTTPTPSAPSGEQGKPSDWAIAKAVNEYIDALQERGISAYDVTLNGLIARANMLDDARELERKHEQSEPVGEVVVTRDAAGAIVAVTRQDGEGRILSTIATAPPPSEQAGISDEVVERACAAFDASGAFHRHLGTYGTDAMRAALQSAFPRGVGSGTKARVAHACAVHACDTCEGTDLANVADYDGALVIDDCPECGGESRIAHPAPEAQAEKPVAWMWTQLMHDSLGGWERKVELNKPFAKPEDVKNLVPLYRHPQPSASETLSADARDAHWRGIVSTALLGAGYGQKDIAEMVNRMQETVSAAIAAQRKGGE